MSELAARVTFVSFGTEDTPVEMTFTIVDKNGKEYYRSVDNTSIQTEGVFNKTFEGLLLDKGKYTLVLTTVYNTNVRDEFKQDFEVGDFTTSSTTKFLRKQTIDIDNWKWNHVNFYFLDYWVDEKKRKKKNEKNISKCE